MSETLLKAHMDCGDEAYPCGVALSLENGDIFDVNQALCNMFGRDEMDIIGESVCTIYSSKDAANSHERPNAIASDPSRDIPKIIRFKNAVGEVQFGEAVAIPVKNSFDEVVTFINLVRRIEMDQRLTTPC